MNLQPTYFSLLSFFKNDASSTEKLWNEIQSHYNEPHRHYHTLTHLENLFQALEPYKDSFADWEIIQFAIFYHDIVYDVFRNDNEERSADRAETVLRELTIDATRIARCRRHILATKGHSVSEDSDTNRFTDADLAILGAESETYQQYCRQIRQEYIVYPDTVYNEGRTKVLKSFLQKPRLFKTPEFQNQFEKQGRLNIERELAVLDSA